MRKYPFVFLTLLSACSTEANHIGNPLLLPIHAVGNAVSNATYGQRRGQVEVFVKTNHPALITDIRAGGGVTLTEAFDIANVPPAARAPHTLQMQSDLALYTNNLGALVVAIMVVSN
ncbi:hypothetical protein L0666_02735 [Octadecabacter sp. CECT 8868]|uniref:hypothetical protein n=1 Tax=Octadecabacter algicola TaxID=2909342 RepID=UPI001F16DC09|nr:hypothetical protein [Octadecabacter algicola]MCF2903890.1 hypothetical protein [Octadecabacter algicola]